MAATLKFRMGGVPEHFNYAWHLMLENHLLKELSFDFSWRDFPGGTGAMAEALANDELDLALLLSEGAVSVISKGVPIKIVGTYVDSPLIWGIHVKAASPIQNVLELSQARFGISRYQSGSHLMAIVHAQQQGWDQENISFELVKNLEGARSALAEDKAQAFMWEKFTTKPLVDRGEWRRIGECPTPWPCFVLVARQNIIDQYALEINALLAQLQVALHLKEGKDLISYIAQKYQLQPSDVSDWKSQTTWQGRPQFSEKALRSILEILQELEIISEAPPPAYYCAPWCNLS